MNKCFYMNRGQIVSARASTCANLKREELMSRAFSSQHGSSQSLVKAPLGGGSFPSS